MKTIIKSLQKISSASDENRKVILKLLERNSKAKLYDVECGSGDFTTEAAKAIEAAKGCLSALDEDLISERKELASIEIAV